MSLIKELRKESGFTQKELAQKAGLSLRTIQRLEKENKEPEGYTLKALSAAFNIGISDLQERYRSKRQNGKVDIETLKLINLSSLAFIGIPFGNIILPYYIWKKNNRSKLIDEPASRIINFQIIWTIMLSFLLCLMPFLDTNRSSSMPLILIVFFIGMGINIIVIGIIAKRIHHGDYDFLSLPIRLI